MQYDHATYRGGELISGSVTRKTSYPSAMARCTLLKNGNFSLHATALRPGTYFIVVQPIAGFMPAILKDGQGHTITVVVSSNTQFPLDLGGGVLSLEREGGAGVNARGRNGATALMGAASEGRTETVMLLLGKGADVNAKDNDGWTALMDAALNGRTEMAKLLLDRGADVNAKANNGVTALDVTTKGGYIDTVDLLRAKMAAESSRGPQPHLDGPPALPVPAGDAIMKVSKNDSKGQGIVPPATPAPAGAATSMNSEMEQFWRGVEGGWIVTENPSERGKLFVHRSKSANALVDLIYLVKVETNGSWTVYKPTRTSSGSGFGRRLGSGEAPRSVSVGLCGCR